MKRTLLLALALSSPLAHAAQAIRYELQLRPDFAARQLHGRARIELQAAAGEEIRIAAPTLQIESARIDGLALTPRADAQGWLIKLPEKVSGSLEITYRAAPASGLIFGTDHVYAAYGACQWLPCVGSELARVSVAIQFELPDGFKSVASDQPPSKPYPLYTLGFAAGRFHEVKEKVGTTSLRYLGIEDDAVALRARFAPTAAMLAFFESRAGTALPQAEYTQVLVPGSAAQEATAHALIGKRMLDPILEDPQEDWVIAHELAHQWWGNAITCAEWRDFWLNEGLTTFMTAAWKQHRWGEAAYQRELALAQTRLQRAIDKGWDQPLSWPGDYPDLSTRRAIHYSKGALFFDALRREMGEDKFWSGLQRYTRENLGHRVKAADLKAAMAKEKGAEPGLSALFRAWVD